MIPCLAVARINFNCHGKDPIDYDQATRIYSMESLKKLHQRLQFFETRYHDLTFAIRNHPDYIKSLEMDNRNKLNIIGNHHPRALEFFIGQH